MDRDFERLLCFGSGIPFAFLTVLISVPNIIILIVFYRNPLRCFRKPFSVFLVFVAVLDLFNGIVVSFGETVMRFLCAFGDESVPRDGDNIKILGYIGVNSSIILVTAMSVDRFLAVTFPHFHLRTVSPRKVVYVTSQSSFFQRFFPHFKLSNRFQWIFTLILTFIYTRPFLLSQLR